MPNPYFSANTVQTPYNPGDRVVVEWDDGQLYSASFLAAFTLKTAMV